MYLLIVFFTSFIALGAMIWHRKREIDHGKVAFSHNNARPFFSVQEITEEVRKCYACVPHQNILSVLKQLKERGLRILSQLFDLVQNMPLKKRVHSIIDAVRGKQEIYASDRPASPFIKDILAHKEQIRNNNKEA